MRRGFIAMGLVWIGVLVVILVPHRCQGRVVLTLSGSHGVHTSDLLAAGVATAFTAVTFVRARRNRMPYGR